LAKHALFTVANLVLNLFKFSSSACCDTTSLLFGIGKRSVFKVLKEDPDNFKDLSNLADCDVDVSVTAARRLVIKL
jgi:hypothetical protein